MASCTNSEIRILRVLLLGLIGLCVVEALMTNPKGQMSKTSNSPLCQPKALDMDDEECAADCSCCQADGYPPRRRECPVPPPVSVANENENGDEQNKEGDVNAGGEQDQDMDRFHNQLDPQQLDRSLDLGAESDLDLIDQGQNSTSTEPPKESSSSSLQAGVLVFFAVTTMSLFSFN